MIIKIGQEVSGMLEYRKKNHTVKAKRMRDDFVYETKRGWQNGSRGDWLVLMAAGFWMAINESDFLLAFDSA